MPEERFDRGGRHGNVARLAPLLLLAFPLSFHCVCADIARNEAYNDTRREAVEAYEFAVPPGQVLAAAQRDLDALSGGRLVKRSGATWIEPPWTASSPGLKARDVLAVRASDAGCRVEARRQELTLEPRRWRSVATERATDLEDALRAREATTQARAPAPDDGRGILCTRPIQVLWADVAALLRERGERLDGTAPESGRAVVESQPTFEAEADDRDRHRVRFEQTTGGVRVSIERIREHTDDPQRWTQHDRDRLVDVEWRLIENLDPNAAERITADAQRAGQAAYERARRRGALSCDGCNDACRGCTREVGGAFVPGCQGCDCRGCQGW
jgi:hypothetical protein